MKNYISSFCKAYFSGYMRLEWHPTNILKKPSCRLKYEDFFSVCMCVKETWSLVKKSANFCNTSCNISTSAFYTSLTFIQNSSRRVCSREEPLPQYWGLTPPPNIWRRAVYAYLISKCIPWHFIAFKPHILTRFIGSRCCKMFYGYHSSVFLSFLVIPGDFLSSADFIQGESGVVVASLSWTTAKSCPCVPGEVAFLLLQGRSLWLATVVNAVPM